MNYAPAGRSAFQRFIWYLPALVITVIFAFPLYWILLTSVKPRALIQNYPPRFRFSPTFGTTTGWSSNHPIWTRSATA